ncbi:MAG: hypothetical protein IT236_11710 [Bacteroidia bacterium]|nr:hypothetical protein [Bacteroidia bacterium]
MSKTVEIEKARLTLLEEGIIEVYFMGDKTIEVADIMEVRRINLNLSEGRPYAVLVESEDMTSYSRETRELLASKGFMGLTKAKALVFKNLAQRIIGNFYLHVNKPHIKTRLFNDRRKAIIWLKREIILK